MNDDTNGFIQVDASKAFNNINRDVLIHNARITISELSTYMTNFYILPIRLFNFGWKERYNLRKVLHKEICKQWVCIPMF